jgi:hypothetical protein
MVVLPVSATPVVDCGSSTCGGAAQLYVRRRKGKWEHMSDQSSPAQPQSPHVISGAGGIASNAAVGRPTVLTTYPHWQYFLALERDLVQTTYFVEPARDNFATYSVAYARILLTAGSEIDVVSKLLCQHANPGSKADSIDQYRHEITSHYPQFPTMRVLVPRYALALDPWAAWSQQQTPEWWQLHQKVKHERHLHFREANLNNALQSVSGLLCLILYYYQPALYAGHLQPWADLFALEQEPGHLMTEANYSLPDF